MKPSLGQEFQAADTTRSDPKDLETCLIIAGCSGAGKSTIIKYSHQLDVHLYGEDFHEDFKKTRNGWPHQEFDDYIEAIKHGSTFEGRHIRELNNEKLPPKYVLIHVDLKLLISTLGYYAASKYDQKKDKIYFQTSNTKATEGKSRNLRLNGIKLPQESFLFQIQENCSQHNTHRQQNQLLAKNKAR